MDPLEQAFQEMDISIFLIGSAFGLLGPLNFDGGGSSALSYWNAAESRQIVCFQQEKPPRPCALNIGIYRRTAKDFGVKNRINTSVKGKGK